jgi:hypothetical protein
VRVPLAAALLLLLTAGCEDIRRFEGSWAGAVSGDPAHRTGFEAEAPMHATVTAVSRRGITMTVDLPGQPPALPFQPIGHAADDVLADLRIEGEPLRTFLGFVRPPTGEPYLAVVSIFAEDHIDVRIIRGPDEIYGVFSLRRQGR